MDTATPNTRFTTRGSPASGSRECGRSETGCHRQFGTSEQLCCNWAQLPTLQESGWYLWQVDVSGGGLRLPARVNGRPRPFAATEAAAARLYSGSGSGMDGAGEGRQALTPRSLRGHGRGPHADERDDPDLPRPGGRRRPRSRRHALPGLPACRTTQGTEARLPGSSLRQDRRALRPSRRSPWRRGFVFSDDSAR